MSEWKEYKFGEIATFSQGIQVDVNFQSYVKEDEYIRFVRIVDYTKMGEELPRYIKNPGDKYLVSESDLVMIRYGSQTAGKVVKGICGAIANNMFKIDLNSSIADNVYVYYWLSQNSVQDYFMQSQASSTMPAITFDMVGKLEILLPPLEEQKRIASILTSLDDKIDLLHRENATLEAMAETLFRQWFIEEAKEDWEEMSFGEVIEIFDSKRKPLSKMERDKMKNGSVFYPYYGAAEIMDYIDSYLFDGEFILMGEDGTVKTDDGYPILQYASGKFWPNNHAHVLQAKPPYNNCFIWNYLKTTNIEYIVTGAVQPKINQANLLSLPFYKYPDDLLEKYKFATQEIWEKVMKNKEQIKILTQMRNDLLNKLMSNEINL